MNRRSFLQVLGAGLAGAAATLTLDPERALWVPGRKTLFDLGATRRIEVPTLIFHRDAFTLVMEDWREFKANEFPCRFDVLYGWAVKSELALRIEA